MKGSRKHLDINEPPDRVHGRLLESVHLSGYTFDRACDELKWLLRQDRWKAVSPGYDDIDKFLATMDLSELRAAQEQRKDLVRQLAAVRAGLRATARLLGVGVATVSRDRVPSGTPALATTSQHPRPPAKSPVIDVPSGTPPTSYRPYYSESGITIYHGDCRDIMPELPRGLMVTDPPYNVRYHYNEYSDALDKDAYWKFLNSVLLMPLVLIHYPEGLFPVAEKLHRHPDEIVAWVYHANTPKQWRAIGWFGISPDLSLDKQSYRNPDDRRIRELMAAGSDGARLYDWWLTEQVKNVSREKTEHPCQIPEALMKRIIQVTPYAEGPVIDPFCGSGTTLLAAQWLQRPAIGIESSEEYCEIAANRLRQQPLALTSDRLSGSAEDPHGLE